MIQLLSTQTNQLFLSKNRLQSYIAKNWGAPVYSNERFRGTFCRIYFTAFSIDVCVCIDLGGKSTVYNNGNNDGRMTAEKKGQKKKRKESELLYKSKSRRRGCWPMMRFHTCFDIYPQ